VSKLRRRESVKYYGCTYACDGRTVTLRQYCEKNNEIIKNWLSSDFGIMRSYNVSIYGSLGHYSAAYKKKDIRDFFRRNNTRIVVVYITMVIEVYICMYIVFLGWKRKRVVGRDRKRGREREIPSARETLVCHAVGASFLRKDRTRKTTPRHLFQRVCRSRTAHGYHVTHLPVIYKLSNFKRHAAALWQ